MGFVDRLKHKPLSHAEDAAAAERYLAQGGPRSEHEAILLGHSHALLAIYKILDERLPAPPAPPVTEAAEPPQE